MLRMTRILSKYDEENISVKIHPDLAGNEQIAKLAKSFKAYKKGGSNAPLFGRDVPFSEDPQLFKSNINKVHIIEEGRYNANIKQYDNKSDLLHLVYCRHFLDENQYCIIHALSPNAHSQARQQEFISVALKRAEKFHSTPLDTKLKQAANI